MMQNEASVKCPQCGTVIPLTEALAGPLLTATKLQMQAKIDAAESVARNAKLDADLAKADIERDIEYRVAEERKRLLEDAEREAAESVKAVHAEAEELRSKLTAAQAAQAIALKHERDLQDRERELDLTIETRVTQEVNTAAAKAETAVDERYKLKLLEKDTLLQSLEAKVNDLQTKLTQGSQQLQGEVQELDLEARLKVLFPFDTIGEVAKGIRGADFGQTVTAPSGAGCGLILYESKRTRNWSQGWLAKLRADGREARADVLVLVSQVVPEEVESFSLIDGIWVCQMKYALALAAVLRDALLRVNAIKQTQAGMASKSELVYQYLTSQQFRRRIEAVVESFTTQQSDLDAEKRAITRAWAKRTAQIENALTAVTGLVGDLQGVGGDSMLEIEGMSLRALGGGDV